MAEGSEKPEARDELGRLRSGIDAIDLQVLDLINQRARLAHRIGEIKRGNLYRPEREAQVLRRIVEASAGPLPATAVQHLFREIMSACLALEQPLSVAYLGPEGTFSESAARKHFGAAPTLTPYATIDDAFRAVEAGNADYAVVPVENSTEGAIGRTLDLLLTSPLKICGEVNLRIHQNLLSTAPTLAAVQRLYGHAQSLAQCHEWLNRNLVQLPRVPVASNAEGARLAAEDPGSAAIAGEAAAGRYGLKVLAANIEDDPNNTTRFLVLAAHDAGASGLDKTSLICSAQNRPGAMHALLTPLAAHGVSLTRLESRPARGFGGGRWEYIFYIDVEGHQQQPAVTRALEELGRHAGFVKILGSYPAAAQ
ncbi:MAG TPA: prephenate dehydratase [Rhodocyclaceae bacterium]|nr:prephenate dehydratase [Rhodocyclaceae bacterium]